MTSQSQEAVAVCLRHKLPGHLQHAQLHVFARFISMLFNTFANKVKDAAVEQLARWFANRYRLQRLGSITDLRFDSAAQEIFVVLALHGEESPIELTVHYRVLTSTVLEITDVSASRPWITELVNHVIPEEQKRLPISPTMAKVLSKLKV